MIVCKLFEEPGEYLRVSDGERVNLYCATQADTPEGLNVGWTSFNNEAEACQEWGLEYLPIENTEETL